MFNNEDILMGSPKKPIIFNIVYAGGDPSIYIVPDIDIDYTDPTTGQKVTHRILGGDSYSFPCAIGDTVKIYDPYGYRSGGRAPERIWVEFFNGVNVSPTRGGFSNGGSCTFTITGESPSLNWR